MQNITTLTADQIIILAERLTEADWKNKTVRIQTGKDVRGNWIKWDTGSGWCAPQYGQPF